MRAVAEDPDQTLPRFLLAVMQDAAGDTATAVASYRAVLASDPAHAGASSYLADLYLRRGDFGDAALHFERAIALGDDDEDTRELLRMAKQRLPGEGNPSANGRNRR